VIRISCVSLLDSRRSTTSWRTSTPDSLPRRMVSPTLFPGTWQPGDDPGQRQFVELKGSNTQGFALEGGGSLPSVTVAFETWGRLDQQRTNAILVLHALSGDSHAVGHLDRDTFRPAGGTDSLDRVHD